MQKVEDSLKLAKLSNKNDNEGLHVQYLTTFYKLVPKLSGRPSRHLLL